MEVGDTIIVFSNKGRSIATGIVSFVDNSADTYNLQTNLRYADNTFLDITQCNRLSYNHYTTRMVLTEKNRFKKCKRKLFKECK